MAGRRVTAVLIMLLFAAASLAADGSPAKTLIPPTFRPAPPETRSKVRLGIVSVVDYEDNHALVQATGLFVAPGRVLTGRSSLAKAVREEKRLNLAMISAGIDANDGPALQVAPSDAREGAPVSTVGTDSEPQRSASQGIEAYRHALRAKADCALAHHNLGLAYGRLGRPRDAASELEQAIRINPTQTGAQYDLGVAYERMGMLREAIDAYQKALGVSPSDDQAYYNLGVAYGKLGRWREAVHAFEETIRIAPDSADAHYNLGLAHLALCQTSQALQQQRDLSSLDKERADKLLHLIRRLRCAAARNRIIPRAATAGRSTR